MRRPGILKQGGLAISDFKSPKEAMEHADKLIEMNKKNYEHDVPKIANGDVMLDQFFYIAGQVKNDHTVQRRRPS